MLSAAACVAVLCCLFASSLGHRSSDKYLAQKFLGNKNGWCLTERTYKTKTDPKVLFKPLAQFYNEGPKWVVEMTYHQPPSTNITYFAHACPGVTAKNAKKKRCHLDQLDKVFTPCLDAVLFRYLAYSRRDPSVPDPKLKLLFLGSAKSCMVAKIYQQNLPIEKESAGDGSDCVLFEVAGKHGDKPSPACEDLFKSKCLSEPKKPMDPIIPFKFFYKQKQPPFTTKTNKPKLPKSTPALEPEEPTENSGRATKNMSTRQKRPKFTRAPKPEEPSENSKTTRKNRTTKQTRIKLRPTAKPEESSGNSEATIEKKNTKQKRPKPTAGLKPEEPSENSKITTKSSTTKQRRPKFTPASKSEESSENSETTTKNKSTRQKRPKFTVAREPEELSETSNETKEK